MEDPPLLGNSVKRVVLAPLLDRAGFYHQPFRIETGTSMDVQLEEANQGIRGCIDVSVLRNRLWLFVIESVLKSGALSRRHLCQLSAVFLSES